MTDEMAKALKADGDKLRALTGEDHGPFEIPPELPPVFDRAPTNALAIAQLVRNHCARGGDGLTAREIAGCLEADHPLVKRECEWLVSRGVFDSVVEDLAHSRFVRYVVPDPIHKDWWRGR